MNNNLQPIGTTVNLLPVNLEATDQDAGDAIVYETSYSWFRVSGNQLVVSHQFDRETETPLSTFTVYARDNAGLTDQGTVTLTFNDINDNAPIFKSKNYNASVMGKDYCMYLHGCNTFMEPPFEHKLYICIYL